MNLRDHVRVIANSATDSEDEDYTGSTGMITSYYPGATLGVLVTLDGQEDFGEVAFEKDELEVID